MVSRSQLTSSTSSMTAVVRISTVCAWPWASSAAIPSPASGGAAYPAALLAMEDNRELTHEEVSPDCEPWISMTYTPPPVTRLTVACPASCTMVLSTWRLDTARRHQVLPGTRPNPAIRSATTPVTNTTH